MSIRISDTIRPAALLVAGLALAGCDPALMGGGGPSRATVNVAGEPIVVAGPPGFCIDRETLNVSDFGAFALMSDCALLGKTADARPAVAAALTASVSSGGLAGEGDDPRQSLEGIAEFAASPEGPAVLGRSGRSDSVRILATETRGDVLYVLVEDRGPQPIAGIDRTFWRAILELNGRMAVLSVLGFEGAGLGAQAGFRNIVTFADTLQAVNGA
jgi:hypothetical protein